MDPMNWEAVYRNHSPGVYQYLRSLAPHGREAEDLLQETFIRAMRSAAGLRQPEKIRSWLLTIARNLFLDACQSRSRQPAAPLEAAQAERAGDDPEAALLRADFARALEIVLGRLPEAHRTAFTLGIVQKLSYQEIAEITGWTLSAVKINIFRARRSVAAALRDHL
ncbi:MAG: RNA polymerase sigma factor [Candidatus Zixiibacteriota bacterium]|nr:MAG: RNA polymerase sigma factor [candidate division Zixibacteria bacterium]